MAINRELTLALAEARAAGRPLYRIAHQAHIDRGTLARIAAGRQTPHPLTREAIAAALGRDVAAIFPPNEIETPALASRSEATDAAAAHGKV
jgi:transcriptional regulator with XRE-family HTH domain